MIEREEGMGGKHKRGNNKRKARVVGNKGQNLKERKKGKGRKEGRKKEREQKKIHIYIHTPPVSLRKSI